LLCEIDADFWRFMLRSKCAIAISCKDGAYYHDWSLDDEYRTADEVVKEDKEEIFAMYKELQDMEGEEKQEVLQELGCGDVPATPEQYIFLLKPLIDAEQMKAGVFKYKSSAPDIEGQNEDPGVGLNTGTCLRCKKPKGAHIAKGGAHIGELPRQQDRHRNGPGLRDSPQEAPYPKVALRQQWQRN
jgi:hypothetical protein